MADTIILEPARLNSKDSIPFCMVFHGNDSTPQAHAEYWRSLGSLGWLVVLPQSSRAGKQDGTFIWNTPGSADWNFHEIQDHFSEIARYYPIDVTRVAFAGFSMGGGLAIELTLGGHISSIGFVVVAPYIPYRYVDPGTNYSSLIKTQAKRGYFVVGEKDFFAVEGTSVLASRLPEMGIACHVEQYPDLEHDYPVNFEQSLQQAMDFILNT